MGLITTTLAQIEVIFSNSAIEALFRSAKHNYLFQQRLESIASLNAHASFYFIEHNEMMPHNAFNGATPIEVYTSCWNQQCIDYLRGQAKAGVIARHTHNTTARWAICPF